MIVDTTYLPILISSILLERLSLEFDMTRLNNVWIVTNRYHYKIKIKRHINKTIFYDIERNIQKLLEKV